MISKILLTWFGVIGLAAIADADAQDSLGKPNIIIILVDDMGYSDVGSYGGEIETPNIDSLAASGIRYSNYRT